jgi:CRP-like cAMP-binding protein
MNSQNRLLNLLPAATFAALRPHLKTVELPFGRVLSDTGQHIDLVYFPHQGVVSLVIELEGGELIETAMTGRDGVVHGLVAMDGKLSLNKAVVQIGGVSSVMSADVLRDVANEHAPLRELLNRHEQVLLAQVQQSVACNASHGVEARMCRWLLRMRDLVSGNDLQLTQEFLAQMLGAARTSVSLVAGTLQRAGLIKYSRGHIHIVDNEALESASCECYWRVRSNYERLLNSEHPPPEVMDGLPRQD